MPILTSASAGSTDAQPSVTAAIRAAPVIIRARVNLAADVARIETLHIKCLKVYYYSNNLLQYDFLIRECAAAIWRENPRGADGATLFRLEDCRDFDQATRARARLAAGFSLTRTAGFSFLISGAAAALPPSAFCIMPPMTRAACSKCCFKTLQASRSRERQFLDELVLFADRRVDVGIDHEAASIAFELIVEDVAEMQEPWRAAAGFQRLVEFAVAPLPFVVERLGIAMRLVLELVELIVGGDDRVLPFVATVADRSLQ